MLRESITKLKEEDLKLLIESLEQGIMQFVDLGDGHFVGVNISNMEILESIGDWSYGKL